MAYQQAFMLAVTTFLAGCIGLENGWLDAAREPDVHEAYVIARTGYIWAALGLPVGHLTEDWRDGHCRATARRIQVLDMALEDSAYYCGRPGSWGCFYWRQHHGVAVLSDELDSRARDAVLLHEVLHHLSRCGMSFSDPWHQAGIVWTNPHRMNVEDLARCDLLVRSCPSYSSPEELNLHPPRWEREAGQEM